MARSLNLDTIAEGIELTEQLTELRAAGCQSGQGFLFAKPLASPALEALLQEVGMPSADSWLDATPALRQAN